MNLKLTIIGLALATGIAATPQATNQVSRTDYSAFRIIGERNIFNQSRQHRGKDRSKSAVTEPVGDAFSLVGTMSYEKGDFAFFDGTTSDYRKIIRADDAIAGCKVTAITPQSVKLEIGGQKIEMKVGAQMRRDDAGAWQLTVEEELPATPADSAIASPMESAGSDSSADVNDVLKKLMQKREQEMK